MSMNVLVEALFNDAGSYFSLFANINNCLDNAVVWMTTHTWGHVLDPTLYSSNGHAFTAVDSRN